MWGSKIIKKASIKVLNVIKKYGIYIFYFLIINLLIVAVSYFYAYQFSMVIAKSLPVNPATLLTNIFNGYTEKIVMGNPSLTQINFYNNIALTTTFIAFAFISLFIFELLSRKFTGHKQIFSSERRIVLYFIVMLVFSQIILTDSLLIFGQYGTGISLFSVGALFITLLFSIFNFIFGLKVISDKKERRPLWLILGVGAVMLSFCFIIIIPILFGASLGLYAVKTLGHDLEFFLMLGLAIPIFFTNEGKILLKTLGLGSKEQIRRSPRRGIKEIRRRRARIRKKSKEKAR